MIGLVVLASLLIATWFGTANLRTDRAIRFDQEARTALAADDLSGAYQKARFAYALAPRDERALTLGALAYLRHDYRESERYFRKADDGNAAARARAVVGLAAAAAQAGDDGAFSQAVNEIGRPANDGVRLALAATAVNDGDLDRAAQLLKQSPPDSQNVGFLKALGQARPDVTAAQRTLAEADRRQIKPSFTDPAYERFVQNLIAVPKDGVRNVATALARIPQDSDQVTRTVTVAETLYGLGDYRAAERLARDAVQSKPDYRDAWNVLGAAQISLREFRDAEKSLKISSDLDSSDGYTWYLRARLAELNGKQDQAAQYQRRADLLGYKKP